MAISLLGGGGIKEAIAAMPLAGGEEPTIDNNTRKGWNNYLGYLDKKGMRGKADLDKGGAGYKYFDDYIKETPDTPLSREKLPLIRKEMNNYRNWVLSESKKKDKPGAVLGEGVNEGNFMRHIVENEKSANPEYPGSQLTGTQFPDSYMNTFTNGQLIKKENLGFASIK